MQCCRSDAKHVRKATQEHRSDSMNGVVIGDMKSERMFAHRTYTRHLWATLGAWLLLFVGLQLLRVLESADVARRT